MLLYRGVLRSCRGYQVFVSVCSYALLAVLHALFCHGLVSAFHLSVVCKSHNI